MDQKELDPTCASSSGVAGQIISKSLQRRLTPVGPVSEESMLENLKRGDDDFSRLERAIAFLEQDNEIVTERLVKIFAERNS